MDLLGEAIHGPVVRYLPRPNRRWGSMQNLTEVAQN